MFIQSITSKLLQELNSNTQSITFRGGSLLQVAADKFSFTTYENYYTETETAYVPVMFDYVSSPKNIPNKELYDWTVDITFALEGENEATIGQITYNLVTSATDISLIRDVVIVNSEKRVLVSMQIFMQSGIDSVFGNNRVVEIKLNQQGASYSEIFPFEFNITMAKDGDAEMELAKNNIKSLPRNRSTLFNLKMFHEDTTIIREFLKDIYGLGEVVCLAIQSARQQSTVYRV